MEEVMRRKKESKLIDGAREMLAYARGEAAPARVHRFFGVKEVRKQLDMTQREFSEAFGFSLDAIKHWESGRRNPERAAQILLKVIAKNPKIVMEAQRD
jgi:putative transcriptional regulator